MTVYTSFQETSFSLYQQLVAPGGLRLRGGERETGRKVQLWWIHQENLNVYNSHPICFDFSINSKKKHIQHNFWSKLGNLTFPQTIFLFNQYLTFHIRSEHGHFTCWGKTGAFFLYYHQKIVTKEIFDFESIWCDEDMMHVHTGQGCRWGQELDSNSQWCNRYISVLSFATHMTT